jgi:enterobactin synthetase component D
LIALRQLFPSWVAVVEEWPDPDDGAAGAIDLAQLPPSLAGAVPKRQREFLAGRRAARQALASLDIAWAAAPLERGPGGAPVWPAGVVGSITHTRGYVAAVAAKETDAVAIGVDAEARLAPARAELVQTRIATRGEIDDFARATGLSPADAVTAIFSAKEALYNCLAPIVRDWFGHLDARVTAEMPGDANPGGFVITLARTLSDDWREGIALQGRFDCTPETIRAGIVIRPR